MVAAKEKSLSFKSHSYIQRVVNKPAHPTTAKPTVVNRISNYDFTARKFKKSLIGSIEKIHLIVVVKNQQRREKTQGENLPRLRRSHWAIEMSQYRGYFVPGGMDPSGKKLVLGDKNSADRFWMFSLLHELCPDMFSDGIGQLRLQENGTVELATNYCERLHIGCTRRLNRDGTEHVTNHFREPLYTDSAYKTSCKCLCIAIDSNVTFTLFKRKVTSHKDNTPQTVGGYTRRYREKTDMDVFVGLPRQGYTGRFNEKVPVTVPGPSFIILGHELCGHAIPQNFDANYDRAIVIENVIRAEHSSETGVDYGLRDGEDHSQELREIWEEWRDE